MTNIKFEKITLTVWAKNCDDILGRVLEAVETGIGGSTLQVIDHDTEELELTVKTQKSLDQETVNQEIHQTSSDTIKRVMYPDEV